MSNVNLGSQHLRGNLDSGVLTVALDRPERRNACTIEMYHGIKKAAVIAEKDPAIDILLTDERMPGRDVQSKQDRFQQGRAETITMGL